MIDIASLDFDITEAIRTEVEAMQGPLSKWIGEDERVKVTLKKAAPDVFQVNMQSHYLGEDIVSEHESHNFHKALELCKDHFIKQLGKRKDIVKNRGH